MTAQLTLDAPRSSIPWTDSNLPGSLVATLGDIDVRVDPIYAGGPKEPPWRWRAEAYNNATDEKASASSKGRERCIAMAELLVGVVGR
jgi:hypothetical protein